ncbi:N-acetylglucosamine-1-phosphate uridyltransferase / Glucosamine-1-phosphate N-acetyltransferase [hydrothermal vent metagenome]|uniref:N-acetylglucosamine-1-phosphate uridyltransferase / Glucosamine-1-phosphate N-acetyltransferase n=1 Tax=hydrothermal vent metagenome TaxID=652676 RepID=A0A3B1BVK2_9ZZZZ
MKLGVVILAAGQGTRMCSSLPKVLHPLAGQPLLGHVIKTALQLNPEQMAIVYGHGGRQVPEAFSGQGLEWVEQVEQLGTGHAVDHAMPLLQGMDRILVLYGDVPLIQADTLTTLVEATTENDLALLTVNLEDPTGYGRIMRDTQGQVVSIVEQKDATPEQLALSEVNTGFLVADQQRLQGWLRQINNSNAQGEYYLTDIVALAVADGVEVQAVQPACEEEVLGVNDRIQLAKLERYFQQQQANDLLRKGVALSDPGRFDLRGSLQTGQDVSIDINVLIEGDVVLGDGICIGANSVIRNCHIAEGTQILENCVLEDAVIGADCRIGPFARIRPGTILRGENNIGNFVEIKKSVVDKGSKINHLSYIGDSDIGRDVNIGAGTITCNYDGANKFKTIIGDNAFIGSDSQLVAPVEIGAGATIGAGSTITTDTPPGILTLSRSKQTSLKGWRRPVKKKTTK